MIGRPPARKKPKAKKRARKTTIKTTIKTALIPRPDGRGALNSGGTPGNKGGTGRPPSILRARLRDSADNRIEVLEMIADGLIDEVSPADRRAAIDTLLKYGLGTKDEISVISEDVVTRLDAQAARFVAELPPDTFAIVKRIVDDVWQ